MIRIGLLGQKGRMGQWVSRLLETEFKSKVVLVATAGRSESLDPLLQTDVVIDFASSQAMTALALLALSKKTMSLPAFVVGSTGWSSSDQNILAALATHTPVLVSANFSTGILALLEILKQSSPLLRALGYAPVVVETHHRHKKDTPSGTALALRKAISPTDPGSVQTHSIRSGEVIGDHEITFYGQGDQISLSHFAQDRSIFARGAIQAAVWLAGKREGSGSLRGIIGIESFFEAIKESKT